MPKFDFFISHSSSTKEIARRLFYAGHMNNLKPWYDENLLSLGDRLHTALQEGIDSSRCFVLLFNEAASLGDGVRYEMNAAKERKKSDDTFRIIVIRLDDTRLPEPFWEEFVWAEWSYQSEFASISKLLETISGKTGIFDLTAASVLTDTPSILFENPTGAIAEHTRNYVLQMITQIKSLISAVYRVGHESELRDTLGKLLQTFLFESVPSLQGSLMPIGAGRYEIIHGNRMRIPPQVNVEGLPDTYEYKVVHNDEISTRIEFIYRETGELVLSPIPFSISLKFSAEL